MACVLIGIVLSLLMIMKFVQPYSRQVTVSCGASAHDTTLGRIELKTSQNRAAIARIEQQLTSLGALCSGQQPSGARASTCNEVYAQGNTNDGAFTLTVKGRHIRVFCEFRKNGNLHWLVFQRRVSAAEDFYKDWAAYKRGFGNLEENFWLGLDNINAITKSRNYQLRVEMEDWNGHTAVAEYSSFSVESEDLNYRLRVSGFSGNAGDSLTHHNNRPFSTKDRDNDASLAGRCAVQYHGAWWYVGCLQSNLNGYYFLGGQCNPRGVSWRSWKNRHYSLKRVVMKIRPR